MIGKEHQGAFAARRDRGRIHDPAIDLDEAVGLCVLLERESYRLVGQGYEHTIPLARRRDVGAVCTVAQQMDFGNAQHLTEGLGDEVHRVQTERAVVVCRLVYVQRGVQVRRVTFELYGLVSRVGHAEVGNLGPVGQAGGGVQALEAKTPGSIGTGLQRGRLDIALQNGQLDGKVGTDGLRTSGSVDNLSLNDAFRLRRSKSGHQQQQQTQTDHQEPCHEGSSATGILWPHLAQKRSPSLTGDPQEGHAGPAVAVWDPGRLPAQCTQKRSPAW